MHRKPNTRRKLVSRILAGLLALMFILTLASNIFLYVFAIDQAHYDRLAELQAQQEELEADQESFESTLAALSDETDKLAERVLLCNDKIDNYVSQITNTRAQIAFYDEAIADLEEEIADAEEQFDVVRHICSLRLQSLAVSDEDMSVWKLVFSSDSLSDIYTRIRTFRYLLATDTKILTYLKELTDELNRKRSELEANREAQNEQLGKLNERRRKLEKASKEYKKNLRRLKKEVDSYQERLAELREARGDLAFQIENEEEIIRSLTADEEARLMAQAQAELEAAKRAEEEEAAKEAVRAEQEKAEEEAKTEEQKPVEEQPAEVKPVEQSPAVVKPDEQMPAEQKPVLQQPILQKPSVPSSGDAEKVLTYASQFLGNPYVWAGTSLTNGCDCSGFVMQIFARFGVYLPHQSNEIRECGIGTQVPVDQMLPGDIVCYKGHVGIYMGDGLMINALNEENGICISSIHASNKELVCGLRVL